MTHPSSEPNALFLATRFSTTYNQKLGWCGHPIEKSCEKNEDCFDNGFNSTRLRYKCDNNLCKYNQWCPAENEIYHPNNVTETITWEDVKDFTIWIKSSINFKDLSQTSFDFLMKK